MPKKRLNINSERSFLRECLDYFAVEIAVDKPSEMVNFRVKVRYIFKRERVAYALGAAIALLFIRRKIFVCHGG